MILYILRLLNPLLTPHKSPPPPDVSEDASPLLFSISAAPTINSFGASIIRGSPVLAKCSRLNNQLLPFSCHVTTMAASDTMMATGSTTTGGTMTARGSMATGGTMTATDGTMTMRHETATGSTTTGGTMTARGSMATGGTTTGGTMTARDSSATGDTMRRRAAR